MKISSMLKLCAVSMLFLYQTGGYLSAQLAGVTRPIKQVTTMQDPSDPSQNIYLFTHEYTLAPDIKKIFEGWPAQDVATLLGYFYQASASPEAVEKLVREFSTNNGRFLVAMLKAMGIDINKQEADGSTPLIRAAIIGDASIIEHLLKEPTINVNLQDGLECSALMYAAYFGHTACVNLLLNHPACDKTIKNRDNLSAQDLALQNNQQEIVRLFTLD